MISRPKVYFDLSVEGKPIGRIVFELFSDITPKTAENFRVLCTGERGFGYKGTKFHRVECGKYPSNLDLMMQGGDYTKGDGRGNVSIYGGLFEDENFALKFTKPYLLGMASSGKNTNGSQFFITMIAYPAYDGKNVMFGEVVEGKEILKEINDIAFNRNLSNKVVIDKCGQL